MTQIKENINKVQDAGVAASRLRLNQLLNTLGLKVSEGSASLISWIVVALLLVNVFFALNLAVGFLLGTYFKSTGIGFLVLCGVYVFFLIVYLIIRAIVEQSVRVKVARRMTHMNDNINMALNRVEALRVSPLYQEAYISGEPLPYNALKLRRDEAKKQARMATEDLKQGVGYIRENYRSVFGSLLETTVPIYRYIAPLASMMDRGSSSNRSVPQGASASKATKQPWLLSLLERKVTGVKPYLPYLSSAYGFLLPVASSLLMGKAQGWAVKLLLGLFMRKKKK